MKNTLSKYCETEKYYKEYWTQNTSLRRGYTICPPKCSKIKVFFTSTIFFEAIKPLEVLAEGLLFFLNQKLIKLSIYSKNLEYNTQSPELIFPGTYILFPRIAYNLEHPTEPPLHEKRQARRFPILRLRPPIPPC